LFVNGGISLTDVAILGPREVAVYTRSQSFFAALLIGLATIAGCKQPSDIELTSDEGDDNVELYAVNIPDPDIATNSVDSTAVLPEEQVKYDGLFVVNSVTWDAGTTMRSAAYSRVIIADSIARVLGRRVGVRGKDLGTLLLDGAPMWKLPHRISVSRLFGLDTSVVFGVEYIADLSRTYLARHTYTWSLSIPILSALNVNVDSPDSLVVLQPRGGTVLQRTERTVIRWTGGTGKVSIIVSRYDPVLKTVVPLMEMRVKANTGRAAIPKKVMAMFPAQRYFVLTFVLSNRKEVQFNGAASATLLVQAASVYNSFVEVQ
jgi:hypothetical protein